MRNWRRKFSIFLLAAAVATANCYGAPSVQAGHHPDKTAESGSLHAHASGELHSHDQDAHRHADRSSKTDGHSDPSKYCCTTMSCAAMAILEAGIDTGFPQKETASAAHFSDAVHTAAMGTVDPPPRTL
jgi:hypothetical protein